MRPTLARFPLMSRAIYLLSFIDYLVLQTRGIVLSRFQVQFDGLADIGKGLLPGIPIADATGQRRER